MLFKDFLIVSSPKQAGYTQTSQSSCETLMRICILNSAHPASDTRVLRIAHTLSSAGHHVTVVSPSGIPPENDSRRLSTLKFIEIGYEARGTFHPQQGFVALIWNLFSRMIVCHKLFIVGWRINADVYQCNEIDSWYVGIILKILLRRRVVFDVHEYYPSKFLKLLPISWFHRPIEKILIWIFSISSSITDGAVFINRSLADFYGFRCQYVVVRNCVDSWTRSDSNNTDALRSKYEGKTVLLHIGRMREEYGTKALLESLALCRDIPDLCMVILGGVREFDLFQQRLDDLALLGRVELINQVPYNQVLRYLEIADIGMILVQPWEKSFVYSLPRKLLEYVAAGLPIIAPNFPEMKSLADQFEFSLLVDPENPKEIAEAIRQLAQDYTLRQKLGSNSKLAFENELNWKMESLQLFNLYESLSR